MKANKDNSNLQFHASRDKRTARAFWKSLHGYYVDVTAFDDIRTRATVEALIREADVRSGYKVLDAGCGNLRVSICMNWLIRDIDCMGIDFTHELLRHGKTASAELAGKSIPVCCADLQYPPFRESSFDAVVSARVFQYISDPVRALKALHYMLKPGGRLALSVPNSRNPLKRLGYRGRLSSPTELGQWLSDAEFTDIRCSSMCFVPGTFGRKWNSAWRTFEGISRLPLLGELGGNAIASGRKAP